jgi:hypothetical protein
VKLHIAHIFPNPRAHGLHSYQEIIDSVVWGLTALGHEVTTAINKLDPAATNIITGFQMLPEQMIPALPPNTIIYHLEQICGIPPDRLKPTYRAAAARLRIWDYSTRNIDTWLQLGLPHPPTIVPLGYAPVLQRIAKSPVQDIDLLFYGSPTAQRLQLFNDICYAGVKSVFLYGLYGPTRDGFIARSKLVLHLCLSRIFEDIRVLYLLSNAKALICDPGPEGGIDADLRDAAAITPIDQIPATCARLAADDAARTDLETRAQQLIQKRDIRPILARAIETLG